jgi:hypothetical protein
MACYTVWGKDMSVQDIYHAPLLRFSNYLSGRVPDHTVKAAPIIIKLKLNVCCVVLAAFSLAVKSPHATLPSSLKAVTAFLLGRGEAPPVVPNPVWVAYNRLAIKDFGGAEGLRRQLVLLRDFILNRNTKGYQAQTKKFYASKTWGSFTAA